MVFLVSPIGEEGSDTNKRANTVKKYLVEKSFPRPDFMVERADDNKNPGHITPQMIASIWAADLVVVDLTGLNPNVFYEAAVVHGYRLLFENRSNAPRLAKQNWKSPSRGKTNPRSLHEKTRALDRHLTKHRLIKQEREERGFLVGQAW
jgi:hypothetical protein